MTTHTEAQDAEASEADADADAPIEDTHTYLKGLIEAILFVTDRPLSIKEIARAAKIDKKRATELLSELRQDYAARGMQIHEVAGGYCFRSSATYGSFVRNFLSQRPIRLSRAQLETLAIIAYRQPITRPEIDDIRGVDSGPVLKGLLERDVIKILGKKDEPGRPMLYGTTTTFLELFNMESLQNLPTLQEFAELSEESRQVVEQNFADQAADEFADGDRVEGSDAPPGPAETQSDSVAPASDDAEADGQDGDGDS